VFPHSSVKNKENRTLSLFGYAPVRDTASNTF